MKEFIEKTKELFGICWVAMAVAISAMYVLFFVIELVLVCTDGQYNEELFATSLVILPATTCVLYVIGKVLLEQLKR